VAGVISAEQQGPVEFEPSKVMFIGVDHSVLLEAAMQIAAKAVAKLT